MTSTLAPELELSAARMDLLCTSHRLNLVATGMKMAIKGIGNASFLHVYAAHSRRADRGDATAARKLAEFHTAASAYEGARVALAELITPTAYDLYEPVCLTGRDADLLREAMAQYAAENAA